MGVPVSSSSDAASDHGQRIGTQSEGCGAEASNNGRRPSTAPQRSARIHIYLLVYANVDARLLRRGLLDNGYGELPVTSEHAVAIDGLPPIHKDPFDRLLVAQSMVEGITLLTSDPLVAQYPAPVRKV